MIFRVFDVESVVESDLWKPPPDEFDKFAPVFAHKIISLVWIDLEMIPAPGLQELRVGEFRVYSGAAVEPEALTEFGRLCALQKPVLVTWNGRKFDGPVLALRAMKHKIPWGWWYQKDPDYRYRYGQAHIDLQETLLDFTGGGMKLDGVARMCGLAGKTTMTGADVAGEAAKGNYDQIGRYCTEDVFLTAAIFTRFQALRGFIDQATAARVIESMWGQYKT